MPSPAATIRRRRLPRHLAAWLLTMLPPATMASAGAPSLAEDPARLATQAERWLAGQHPWQGQGFDVAIHAQALDPRLRLARCQQSLAVSLPPGQVVAARTTVLVSCPDQTGWRLLLPVNISARAEVLVARQALPAGTPLAGAATERQWRDIAGMAQGYLAPGQVADYRTRMTVPAGAVISRVLAEPLPLVRRGQQVTLQASVGGIAISMAGEALADAGRGERVRVRNRQSGKMLEGQVVAEAQVRMLP